MKGLLKFITCGSVDDGKSTLIGYILYDAKLLYADQEQALELDSKVGSRAGAIDYSLLLDGLMGIRHFVFAINKMDLEKYSEDRYHEIEKELQELIDELSLEDVAMIPLSATEGDNVTEKSPNMPWHKGKALLPYLEEVDVVNKSETGFVFPIQRVCRPNHTFRGFAGQIEAGRSQLTLDG